MTKVATISCRTVDTIPRRIDHGVLYVSYKYGTAVHLCCCGCGHQVVTPLGPTDWKASIERNVVSVYPSIGNWSLACRSHYWIDGGRVHWADQWSQQRIEYGRRYDRIAKQRQYGELEGDPRQTGGWQPGFWERLWRWFVGGQN